MFMWSPLARCPIMSNFIGHLARGDHMNIYTLLYEDCHIVNVPLQSSGTACIIKQLIKYTTNNNHHYIYILTTLNRRSTT